ncbi:MAG: copper transporter, partial [Actinomycetota bacterium]|nr:copper transporter [Actinomycetota bacterium]
MNPYRLAGLAILVISGAAGLIAALVIGGGAVPPKLLDPGPVVMWGLPAAKLIANLGAAAMLGSLVLALFGLRAASRPFEVAVDTASVGAAVFTIGSGVTAFLTFMAAFNPKLTADRGFGEQFGRYLLELPLGQAWLITTLMGAVITLLLFGWR